MDGESHRLPTDRDRSAQLGSWEGSPVFTAGTSAPLERRPMPGGAAGLSSERPSSFRKHPPMTRIYPNIVPQNNLRLPDALTLKHGPAPLLARFVLEGDKATRRMGLHLRLRHDFAELRYVNRQQVAMRTWFPLVKMYDPEYSDLIPENSYWISGEDEHGEIVLTQAGRVYYWPGKTLEDEARSMFYAGHDEGRSCRVTAIAAKFITGVVCCAGAHWIRPDFRGHRLSHLLARLGRAYAVSRWPVDWGIALVAPVLVENGVSAGYGYKHASHSIFYPGSLWGNLEVVLAYLSAAEAYDDIAEFMATELSDSHREGLTTISSRRLRDESVTRTSSEGVFHGSSNLS
jgi:hypothetical protein